MLRFLHSIENMNDAQLKKAVSYKIKKLERKSMINCPYEVELGYEIGQQPHSTHFEVGGNEVNPSYVINCVFGQFARKDTKMIYGLSWNTENYHGCNNGYYYYMDNQDYLYDFCQFVKDKEVEDEYEFFEYVRDFLQDYFGTFKKISRDQMHQLLLKSDDYYYEPVKEHSITDFKGKGNAMCSEYAIMAHNILKLFDFETYLIVGNVILDGKTPVAHAYNLITFTELETREVKHAVVDFINDVDVFDIEFNKIGKVPFMGYISDLDLDFIGRLVNGEEHLQYDEYRYLIIGDTVLRLGLEDRNRDYFIDNYIYANQDVNCRKIYAKKMNL